MPNDEAVEKKDKRPWWKKKTNIGLIFAGLGGTLAAIPGAPVILTAGAIHITVPVIANACTYIGAMLGVYGIADRVTKK